MLNYLKNGVAVLLGLALGCLAGLLLAWYGSRLGADALKRAVWNRLAPVQERQQQMADEALGLQPLLHRFGFVSRDAVFRDVERHRALLAGEADLEDKLARVQLLEESLLRSAEVRKEAAAARKRLAAWPPFREDSDLWERQTRLLVREEQALTDSVDEYNRVFTRWPMSVLLAHRSFLGLTGSFFTDAGNVALFATRVGLDWTGYGLRRVASLVGNEAPPPVPDWSALRPHPKTSEDAYAQPLAPLVFLAGAPLPEGQYREVQFTHEVPANYADVEMDADAPVLENRNAPKPYQSPALHPQKTVTYSAPN